MPEVVRLEVPGHGIVEWSGDRLDGHAAELRARHTPDGPLHRWSFVPPFRRRTEAICACCAQMWPCRSVVWSAWWSGHGRSSLPGGFPPRHRGTRRPSQKWRWILAGTVTASGLVFVTTLGGFQ